jgi:myo-inositol-1(or 4)-monophosphatase
VEGLAVWLDGDRYWWSTSDSPIRNTTTRRTSLDGAAVSMLRPRTETFEAWTRVARRIDRVRVLGSSVLEGCLVADGAIDAFCDPGGDIHRIVDLAALDIIIRAAGGVVVDLHGRELTYTPDLSLRWSGIVAATPQLADELRMELLRS